MTNEDLQILLKRNASLSIGSPRKVVEHPSEKAYPISMHGNCKPPKILKCLTCDTAFSVIPSSFRKFCSTACAYKSKDRVKHMVKKDRGTRICMNCENEFTVHTSAPKARFCCLKCSSSLIGRLTIVENRKIRPPSCIVSQHCKNCGVEFSDDRSSKRIYCSRGCSSADQDQIKRRVMAFNAKTNKARIYSRCKNGWVIIGGQRFFSRSSWEANYARYLDLLQTAGEIIKWEHEPETFWFDKIKRGVRSYLPDFKVTTAAGIEFHEVKGWMDARSKTKIKRMAKYYPSIKLVVIDQFRYRAIARAIAGTIPGWTGERVTKK